MEIDRRRETIQRGISAKALLNDETLSFVLDSIAHEQFISFAATDPDGRNDREKIWATLQSLRLVKDKLEALVASGRIEEENKKHDDSNI